MDWPCCLYIVYIETVIYISTCLKQCINVRNCSPGRGERMASDLLLWGTRVPGVPAQGWVGVGACDTHCQPAFPPPNKYRAQKSRGNPGGVEMGIGLAEEQDAVPKQHPSGCWLVGFACVWPCHRVTVGALLVGSQEAGAWLRSRLVAGSMRMRCGCP